MNIQEELNLPDLQYKLSLFHDKLILKHGKWENEYEEQILSLNYIKPDSFVLELGGNIGRNSMIISFKFILEYPTKITFKYSCCF